VLVMGARMPVIMKFFKIILKTRMIEVRVIMVVVAMGVSMMTMITIQK